VGIRAGSDAVGKRKIPATSRHSFPEALQVNCALGPYSILFLS